MKQLVYLILISSLVFCLSCQDDDSNSNLNELSFDQGENSAPLFSQGIHEAAVRFPASLTEAFSGQNLDRVEFYLVNTPSNCSVKIYDAGSSTEPGPLLYETEVTSTISPNSWNSHTLTEDIQIDGRDIWIAIEITHPDERNTIGCDIGPAVTDGDWVRESSVRDWRTFRAFTNNQVSINWNIRGYPE